MVVPVMPRRKAISLILAVALFCSLAGIFIGQAGLVPKPPPGSALGYLLRAISRHAPEPPGWQHLSEVRDTIEANFVEDVDGDLLLYGAMEGMFQAIDDPYAAFFDPERYRRLLEHYQESFTGIGVRVQQDEDRYLKVVRPLPDTPGERAGLLQGDRIITVDGQDIQNLTLEEQVGLIRGPAGTQVRLTVERRGAPEHLSFTITRAVIPMPVLEYRMLDDGIAYVQIIDFNKGLGDRLNDAMADLRRQGMRGLVLDVRGNPGGLLNAAVEAASVFVPRGPVAHVVYRDGRQETLSSRNDGFELPLVLLIDGGSASASEILAGAIRDRLPEAVLVGTTTFGKGSVQNFYDLSGGSGLKLTTARYLTAGGHMINGTGIDPHEWVELPEPQEGEPPPRLDDPANPQLQRAIEILRQRLR